MTLVDMVLRAALRHSVKGTVQLAGMPRRPLLQVLRQLTASHVTQDGTVQSEAQRVSAAEIVLLGGTRTPPLQRVRQRTTALYAMLDATERWQARRRSVVASVHQEDSRWQTQLQAQRQMTASSVVSGSTWQLVAVMQLRIALSAMLGAMVRQGVPRVSARGRVRAAGTRWQIQQQVRVQMTVSRVMRASMA